uniref:Putative TMD protein n=1 Tax=Aedes anphevirus TaxID=2230910 RepID=A0A2Z4HF58_9MONO|nr:putative TMD protein [Aedes anphevirus]
MHLYIDIFRRLYILCSSIFIAVRLLFFIYIWLIYSVYWFFCL